MKKEAIFFPVMVYSKDKEYWLLLQGMCLMTVLIEFVLTDGIVDVGGLL